MAVIVGFLFSPIPYACGETLMLEPPNGFPYRLAFEDRAMEAEMAGYANKMIRVKVTGRVVEVSGYCESFLYVDDYKVQIVGIK